MARFAAMLSLHIWSAFALPSENIAVIIERASWVTITWRTTIVALGQSIGFRHALITIAANDQALTGALASVEVAAEIVNGSQYVACAFLATIWISFGEVPVAFLADVASSPFYMSLAMTSASNIFTFGIGN